MPVNDLIDQHTDALLGIIERLPNSYRSQVKATEAIARGTPSFLTALGSTENMQAFILSVRNNKAKIEEFLRETFAKLLLKEENVPVEWGANSKGLAEQRMLTAAEGYHRTLNATLPPNDLRQQLKDNIHTVMRNNPHYYILILWSLLPEVVVH